MGTFRLTAAQFRMLQRIPDEGLSPSALHQGRREIAAQIRTLRQLNLLGLVVETQSESGFRFQITDAGRKLARPDHATTN